MEAIHEILDNGYARVQIPEAAIDATYNPLSTTVASWPSDWYMPDNAGKTWN